MEHTELLALILPPQGRLVVAAADSGPLPPALVLALEHKAATGSQTVAGRLDTERVEALYHALGRWLTRGQPATSSSAHLMTQRGDGTVDVATDTTVAHWLASGAEGMDL